MWIAWFVVGLLLLVTKRYVKKTWKLSHFLHMFFGCFVLAVTVLMVIRVSHFRPFENFHNAIGSLCCLVTIFGSVSGFVTAAMMHFYNGDKQWSKSEKVELIAKIHRYFGYIMLLLSNVAIMTGVGHYYGDRL